MTDFPIADLTIAESTSLTVDKLSFAYPDGHQVLNELSIAVKAGERVALLGPNGAGKTTLALHLNGILELQSGTIRVENLLMADKNLVEIRRLVGMVFQDSNDQLFMSSVEQDVAFGPSNLNLSEQEMELRVTEALKSVDAEHLRSRSPHHLSGGEKRRIALATVLAMNPQILVLDEPTSGLDPAARREIANLLGGLPYSQLVITHDLPFALEICPRAVIVSDGKVVADGSTVEILSNQNLLLANRLELPLGFDPQAV